jgi:Cu(I)/Ag(I) efflux system membrane fusion protein
MNMNEPFNTTKAGKKNIISIVVLGVLLAAAASWYFFLRAPSDSGPLAEGDYYTCPMHPQVHSDKPGNCPICGMKLVKHSTLVTKSGADSSAHRSDEGLMLSNLAAVKANVSTVFIEEREMHEEVHAPGVIEIAEPNERAISARVRGRIEKLYVSETGAYVEKGKPLYEYYSPDLSADVAQFLIARNASTHMEMDHGGGHVNLEHTASERLKLYGLSEKEIDEFAERGTAPETFTVRSPASGTIMKKATLEGAWLDEGTLIFQIADLSTVWAYFDIPEQAISSVHTGQSVSVTSPSYPLERFTGTVIFISPVVNQSTRTARIRVSLVNSFGKLKIQLAVEGAIHISDKKMLAVPASALVQRGNENFVWVKRSDGMFYPVKVALGFRDGDYYGVIAGLSEGDEVGASGTFLLDSERQLKAGNASMPEMNMNN